MSWVRTPAPERLSEGHRAYKKGWELRFVLWTEAELTDVRQLLERAGLKPGKSFQKAGRWIQSVYGRAAVERLSRP